MDKDKRPPKALGFDAALDFQPFSRSFRAWLKAHPDLKSNPARGLKNRVGKDWQRAQPWKRFDRHHDMEAFVAYDICQDTPDYPWFPGVCPSWDNSARRPPGEAIIFQNTSPFLFGDWIRAKTRAMTPAREDENFVFINAWNEWAEGNHLEPCLRHGHNWLDALRDSLGNAVAPEVAIR